MVDNGPPALQPPGRCHAITSAGAPCRMRPLPGRAWCLTHDPERAEERSAARRRGGYGKSNKARLRKTIETADLSAKDTLGILAGYYLKIAAGEGDRATLATLAMAARAILEAVRVTDLEAQLADMRRQLADLSESVAERERRTA